MWKQNKLSRGQKMNKEIEKLSFEEAMEELETVVRQLETGKIKLDEAVTAYERGMKLKKICDDKLADAKGKIDKLILDKNNKPTGMESFDVQVDA